MYDQWKLSDLYQSTDDPTIEADFQQAEQLIAQLQDYRDKIASLTSEQLLELITTWEKVQVLLSKVGLYAALLESTHIGEAAITRFNKATEERIIQLSTQLIFIETELAQLSEEAWQKHLKSPALQPYHKFVSELHEQAKHTLSEPEEKILAEKSQTSRDALLHLYSLTTDTLLFDWQGERLTLEEVVSKFHDPDPETRRQAALTLHEGLKNNDKTTPAILNALIQDKTITDRLRHYDYPEQARFIGDDVDKETVEALVTAVSQSYSLVERYYRLKKQIMGTEELYWWDRYAPLPETKEIIEQPEAIEKVLTAFNAFSPEIATIAQEMMEKEHIDWNPSPTKRGGAFCADANKKTYPYVLLNYTKQPRDVMTLAHELGHAIHDVLADKENVYIQTHPSLALAEIASVFGETLLFEQLINTDLNKQDKISLMMNFIEDRFATIFRQTTMFQFEQQLHTKRRAHGELSKEEIDTLWHETMKQPFESALTYTDEHRNTWMYVQHVFNWPFYVYSYTFAQLCVLALYKQYKEQGQSFVPTYLEILKRGGSLSPKDNLKLAGFDLTDANFWQQGLQVIEGFIDDLESLVETSKRG